MFKINPKYHKETGLVSMEFEGEMIDGYKKLFEDFFREYEVDDLIIHRKKRPKLKPKKSRICRFCGKDNRGTTFKSYAHIIPEFMGNKNLISDYECDACNAKFSKYEDEFARFMGVSRTMTFIDGKKGIPKFITPKKDLIIEEKKKGDKDELGKMEISSIGEENDNFEIDEKNKKLIIHSVKHPYTPLIAIKCLLKIAYSLLPEEELDNYKGLLKILMTDEHDARLKGNPFFRVMIFFSPGPPFPYPIPMIFMCKKKNKEDNRPNRIMTLYIRNYIYQIFYPFDEVDRTFCEKGKEVKLIAQPPFIDKEWADSYGKPSFVNLDMSGTEVTRNEKQIITMSFDSVNFNL